MNQRMQPRRGTRAAAIVAVVFGSMMLAFVALTWLGTATADESSAPEPTSSTFGVEPSTESITTPSVLGTTTTLSDSDPATLYVSPDGDDANSGQSPEIPLRTIEHAIRETKVGMTLFVMDGTFTITSAGPTQIAFRRDGSPTAWTRITAAPGAKPIIVAKQGTAFEPSGSYIEISGLTVRGENFSESNAYGVGILVADGHHFDVSDNVVSGFPVGGIAAVRASHLRFERNVVYDNSKWGPEQGSGLSTWIGTDYGFPDDEHGYTDYFVDNVIYRNENRVTSKWSPGNITDGNGIIIDTNIESGFSGRTLIANNIIVDNGGRSITVFRSQRVDIVNNSTYANGTTGAALLGGGGEVSVFDGRDVRLSNNLLWNDGTWPTLLVGNSSDVSAVGNAFVGGGVQGLSTDGNLVLSTDPGLVSAAPGPNPADFQLTPTSPLIDAGVDVPAVIGTDFFGGERVVGGGIDIGAIEHASTRPSDTPQPTVPEPAPTTTTTVPQTTSTSTTTNSADDPESAAAQTTTTLSVPRATAEVALQPADSVPTDTNAGGQAPPATAPTSAPQGNEPSAPPQTSPQSPTAAQSATDPAPATATDAPTAQESAGPPAFEDDASEPQAVEPMAEAAEPAIVLPEPAASESAQTNSTQPGREANEPAMDTPTVAPSPVDELTPADLAASPPGTLAFIEPEDSGGGRSYGLGIGAVAALTVLTVGIRVLAPPTGMRH